ncbi:MAG: Nitrilase/cyanide hydratase and apolipoprotein N-acyltransferase, partial [Anaerocolumna sp.]|nr:Nitrilase/cyanide hydratase and apolipoprotein N-acyltransferase [Anaerocolumna sp.]
MRFAICQMDIKMEDTKYNVFKAEEAIKIAADKKADIILFSEMSFTGFSMNVNLTKDTNGEVLSKIINYAVKNNISIGYGWVNKDKELAENHYSIIDITGTVVLDYIKIHPFSYADENKYFLSGNEIKYCRMNNVTLSTFICYDLRFPEIFQVASKVADVIIVAANWPDSRAEHWNCLLKARAIENQVYVIGINCTGRQGEIKYSGNSCIINPNGNIVSKLNEEEKIIFYDIEDDVMK